MITIADVILAWNTQADEFNQWESLNADGRVNFALQTANVEIDRLNFELDDSYSENRTQYLDPDKRRNLQKVNNLAMRNLLDRIARQTPSFRAGKDSADGIAVL